MIRYKIKSGRKTGSEKVHLKYVNEDTIILT